MKIGRVEYVNPKNPWGVPAGSSREMGASWKESHQVNKPGNAPEDGRGCRPYHVLTVYWVSHRCGGSVGANCGDKDLAPVVVSSLPPLIGR